MDDYIHNPVGNEHPLRGCMIGAGLLVALTLAILGGCVSCIAAIPREWESTRTSITNAVRIVAEVAVQVREARRDKAGEASGDNSADPAQTANPAKSGGAPALDFRFGGFKGGSAVETQLAQIGSLHMTRNGLSYKWVKGGCEALGATSREDYSNAVACAFYWDERIQKWVGGKFDWISTSRTSRDFKNIHNGYGGWLPEEFFWASKRAFCIVSADGKKRTNLLETNEP